MTETTTLSVAEQEITVPVIYEEGHSLKSNEAAALNQLWRENVRNNLREKIKKAIAEGQDPQTVADEYIKTYEFGVRASSSGSRKPADPVKAEALRLATVAIKNVMKQKGYKLSEHQEEIRKLAKQAVETRPEFMEKAREAVESAKELTDLVFG